MYVRKEAWQTTQFVIGNSLQKLVEGYLTIGGAALLPFVWFNVAVVVLLLLAALLRCCCCYRCCYLC